MGMHGEGDVRERRPHLNREGKFADQVARVRTDNRRAEEHLRVRIRDEFHEAVVFARLSARPIAAKGTRPTRVRRPWAVASASWSPTVAISGSVKIAAGIAWTSSSTGWPAMTSAAVRPSFVALCARNGGPITSPIAYTCGFDVRSWRSTFT